MSSTNILFQNREIIAVEKPAGVSVHNQEGTQNLLELLEREMKFSKLYPIHRLDKETSGIQLLALNSDAARIYAEAFQDRKVKKLYIGVLRGQLKTPAGLWHQPLTDKSEGRRNPQGLAKDRVPCETRFQVVKASSHFTLCDFDLITGRQHQIRKHAALAKHQLVGDARYGDPSYNEKMATQFGAERMYLHCKHISILGQNIACPTPTEFEALLNDQR